MLTYRLPRCHQAGYFRLDDINAKLKEQVQQAEEQAQQEQARCAELEQQCERLRRSGGSSGLDSEAAAQLSSAQEVEQLKEKLRQAEHERDKALRQAANGAPGTTDDGCFEPTRSGTTHSLERPAATALVVGSVYETCMTKRRRDVRCNRFPRAGVPRKI